MKKRLIIIGIILLLIFPLIPIGGGIACYFLPRQYYSKVTVELSSAEYSGPAMFEFHEQKSNQDWIQIIHSKEILQRVIDNLKLTDKWSKQGKPLSQEAAYEWLTQSMAVHEIRNTDLLEIGVYSTDPKEAAEIANSIALVLQKNPQPDNPDKIQGNTSTPVKIWEKAEPAVYPTKPNISLFMTIAVGIGLLFAFPGGILILIGLLQPKPAAKG